MQLTHRDIGGMRVIDIAENRIDASVAIQFKDRVRELTEDAPARVLLDMKSVDFLDSSGLGAVVAVMKQVGTGRSLELAGLTPTVLKVFTLTRMDTVFRIHPDVSAAQDDDYANAS